jgi:peptidoglycan-N-acetylglucosamine deacetylase
MISALPIGGGCGGCGVGAMAWAVRGRASAVFGPSVWRGPRERRAVALTFDDGPSEGTPRILEILAAHGAEATFFPCGANVARLPAVARAVADAGHEIGNHGYATRCAASARRVSSRPTWRARNRLSWSTPGRGRFGFARPMASAGSAWAAQRRLGLKGVMWTVIGYDWNSKAEAIVERMAGRVSNGAILCLHDGRELRAGRISAPPWRPCAAWFPCCWSGAINWKR